MKRRRVAADVIFDGLLFSFGLAVGLASLIIWADRGAQGTVADLVAMLLVPVVSRYPLVVRQRAGDIVIGFESTCLVFLVLTGGGVRAVALWSVAAITAQLTSVNSRRAQAFNMGMCILAGALAVGVFEVTRSGPVNSPRLLAAVMASAASYFLFELVTTAISLVLEARMPLSAALKGRTIAVGLGCFVGVNTLGFLAALLNMTAPRWVLLLLLVPVATILVAVSSLSESRLAQQRLAGLFETATSASDWPDAAHVERALVEQGTRILRKTRVELRDTPALSPAMGVTMQGPDGRDRYLVAERFAGRAGARFSADDVQALTALAAIGQAAYNRQRLAGEMTFLARHDALTGLANRAVFADRLEHALTRRQGRVAVLFCDLDGFKAVNDRLGHAVGDEVLVVAAGRIAALVRPSDTAARIGGDEFAVLVEDVGRSEDALVLADRIRDALHRPFPIDGREVRIGVSIGIAPASHGDTGEELLRNADTAMYQAKVHGRGRCQLFHPQMRIENLRRLELEDELRLAVDRGSLRVYFQPVVDLATGRIDGFEALARWHHPRLGVVRPDVFIPLAEHNGLIQRLGVQVLQQAHAAAVELAGAAGRTLTIGINLSPLQLDDPGLVPLVADLVAADSRVTVMLELTEGTVLGDSERTSRVLHQLRDAGAVLAVDDFGVGYASVSYLRKLPVEIVKIDRSFVEALDDPRTVALVEGIVAMAAAMGMRVIGEGIEAPSAVSALAEMGCEQGQGFLYSPAVTLSDALRMAALGRIVPAAESVALAT